jgi:ribosomal protein S18 acetylase RimI-like enzyme
MKAHQIVNWLCETSTVPGRKLVFSHELDNDNIYIKTLRGNPVGCIWWRPQSNRTILIEHLEISSHYQNQGLGEALLREFARVLPSIYPNTKYLVIEATSSGIIRLCRRVFGIELGKEKVRLPLRSPENWISTSRRARVKFHFQPE